MLMIKDLYIFIIRHNVNLNVQNLYNLYASMRLKSISDQDTAVSEKTISTNNNNSLNIDNHTTILFTFSNRNLI